MKAIILAAGMGTRLGQLTAEKPKCLAVYKGKALLDHQVETLQRAGVRDITVVCGYKAETITRSDISCVVNERFAVSNMVTSLFCAENIMNDDIVVSYGDIVYQDKIVRSLLNSNHECSVVVDELWYELWKQRMSDPLQDAETLILDEQDRIIELGKKPDSYDQIQGQYIGLIKLTSDAVMKARDFYHQLPRDEYYDSQDFDNMFMTSFLQKIIDDLMPVHAVKIRGGWVEIDTASDLTVDFVIDD